VLLETNITSFFKDKITTQN